MIGAQVSKVYEVELPVELSKLLDDISSVLSLGLNIGLEASPLACFGLAGFTSELRVCRTRTRAQFHSMQCNGPRGNAARRERRRPFR